MFKLITETIKNLNPDKKDEILKNESTNFIIKQSFNIIIKIISGINLVKENDLGVQETLVKKIRNFIMNLYYFSLILNWLEKISLGFWIFWQNLQKSHIIVTFI